MSDNQYKEFRELVERTSIKAGYDSADECEYVLLRFMTSEFATGYLAWREKGKRLVRKGKPLVEGQERRYIHVDPGVGVDETVEAYWDNKGWRRKK